MKFSVEEFTPEIAKQILDTLNKKNRRLGDRIVRAYASDMANGKWLITGDPLRFSTDGSLIDGQHRLAAIVKSGVTINLPVVRGLDREVQDVIDTGRKRTPGNVLELRGIANATAVAAVARVGVAYDAGLVTHSTTRLPDCTHQDLIVWTEKNVDTLAPIISPSTMLYRGMGGALSAMTWSFHQMSLIDHDKTMKILEDLNNLNTDGMGDPKSALLRRLQKLSRSGRERTTPSATIYALFRMWNALQRGQSMTLIVDSPEGKLIPKLIEK